MSLYCKIACSEGIVLEFIFFRPGNISLFLMDEYSGLVRRELVMD
jgi:hypothetical protein